MAELIVDGIRAVIRSKQSSIHEFIQCFRDKAQHATDLAGLHARAPPLGTDQVFFAQPFYLATDGSLLYRANFRPIEVCKSQSKAGSTPQILRGDRSNSFSLFTLAPQ